MAINGNFNLRGNLQTNDGSIVKGKVATSNAKLEKTGNTHYADFYTGKDAFGRIRPGDTYDGKVVKGVTYDQYEGRQRMVLTLEGSSTPVIYIN